MNRPIPDKAEITVASESKRCAVAFDDTAQFAAHLDQAGISVRFDRRGGGDAAASAGLHFGFAVFSEILEALAETASSVPPAEAAHRDMLRKGAHSLCQALDERRADRDDLAQMTPEDEVLLLHVME